MEKSINGISRELEETFTVNGICFLFVGSFLSGQLAFWVDFPFKLHGTGRRARIFGIKNKEFGIKIFSILKLSVNAINNDLASSVMFWVR